MNAFEISRTQLVFKIEEDVRNAGVKPPFPQVRSNCVLYLFEAEKSEFAQPLIEDNDR